MDHTNETISDIMEAVNKVQRKVSELNADNLNYTDIRYIRGHLMDALSDTDDLVDDLLAETIKDHFGDYEYDQDDQSVITSLTN